MVETNERCRTKGSINTEVAIGRQESRRNQTKEPTSRELKAGKGTNLCRFSAKARGRENRGWLSKNNKTMDARRRNAPSWSV